MNEADDLLVDLGERSYHILVGGGLIENGGTLISPLIRQRRSIIITDQHLKESGHLDALTSSLIEADIDHEQFVLPPGEQTKCLEQYGELADSILQLNIERGTSIIALGGGVIGDLAGFLGATLLRGLDVIQIPTTLLAQVDSSVGGKTGINSTHGKNLIGSFHQPKLVLADTSVLDSLPARELRAGYAEVLKYGLISRPKFFDWLEKNGQALIAGDVDARRYAVIESCRAKAEIVVEDERESGRRALLNLGHTFGHALEAMTGYGQELLHGEAVAIGMTLAFKISAKRGHCPHEDVRRMEDHLMAVDLPTSARTLQSDISADAMIAAMSRDKKVEAGIPRFVLSNGIGAAFSGVQIERPELEAFLQSELD